jgi:hypothetical protein
MSTTMHATFHKTAIIKLLSSFRPAHVRVLPYALAAVVAGRDPISVDVIILLLRNMSELWVRMSCVWELASLNKM